MPTMAWIWSITILVLLACLLQQWAWKSRNKKSQLPPGPKGFPILGYFPMLGELPHHDLSRLAQKYGPIMHLRLGLVPTIVVSSPQAAELFLKEQDVVFASRPPQESAKHMSYEQQSMTFAPYNSYWRNVRRICMQEMLGNSKVDAFTSMRREELSQMIKFIQDASRNCVAVDLSAEVSSLSAAMSCRMVFGKKYMDEDLDERGFKAMVHEVLRLVALPNLNDYIPCLKPFDLQGLTRSMKAVSKIFDDFFERIIHEHLHSKDQTNTKDFVDVLLSFMGSEEQKFSIARPNVKAIILDMLAGSMDTSAAAIEWTLSELIKHPQVMKKLQKELEDVVGLERTVEETDLDGLKYLDLVVKEAMRLHPVAPLLLPREAAKDCVVSGFHIPRKSRVLINAWAIGRDPSVWTDAEKFLPERFAGSDIDVRGRDFQLIPFGSGRRICPGMQLGLTVVRLVVAQLVHCFDWKLPNNTFPAELDMTEKFGLATPRAKPLFAIPTFRLRM